MLICAGKTNPPPPLVRACVSSSMPISSWRLVNFTPVDEDKQGRCAAGCLIIKLAGARARRGVFFIYSASTGAAVLGAVFIRGHVNFTSKRSAVKKMPSVLASGRLALNDALGCSCLVAFFQLLIVWLGARIFWTIACWAGQLISPIIGVKKVGTEKIFFVVL
jgi:hypothetical protein